MCKDWGIETDALLRECYALTRDVDYGQMAWVHDEYQYEHREEGFGQIIQEASARAISITAEKFDFRENSQQTERPALTGTTVTKGRSRIVPAGGYFGPMPMEVWDVLDKCWFDPPSISSNYARERAPFIALASSLGWITIIAPDGLTLSRSWHVTYHGLSAYQNKEKLECS